MRVQRSREPGEPSRPDARPRPAAPARPAPGAPLTELQHRIGNAAVGRLLRPARPGPAGPGPVGPPVQRSLTFVVGPETEDNPHTLSDSAAETVARNQRLDAAAKQHGPHDHYTQDDLDGGRHRRPGPTEDLYFIAHGDDPHGRAPRFGDRQAPALARDLKKILAAFSQGDQYRGNVHLLGCHTATRRYGPVESGESGEEALTGGSFLDTLLDHLKKQNWAKEKIAPEVQFIGYPGTLQDSPASNSAGSVAIDSPFEIEEFLRGHDGAVERGKGAPYLPATAEDAEIRTRWRAKYPYKVRPRKG
ncbi:hypothetical protein [Kitasatospora sp. NPDC089509]|uniref:hypothetical protein n=1 Tax=Kitasatospora sp. NPDC089509 TaxID=3364079 RepID=UPI0038015FC9